MRHGLKEDDIVIVSKMFIFNERKFSIGDKFKILSFKKATKEGTDYYVYITPLIERYVMSFSFDKMDDDYFHRFFMNAADYRKLKIDKLLYE